VNGGRDHAPGKNKSVVPIDENCDGMISGLRLGPGYCPPPATYVATVQGAPQDRRVQLVPNYLIVSAAIRSVIGVSSAEARTRYSFGMWRSRRLL
jgi:hypothetical protein